MQTPRNELASKFQGTLEICQKVIIRFWWESELSSASKFHLTTFCRHFVHHACLRLFSAMVYFIRNNCLYFVCYSWSAYALIALAATLLVSAAWLNCCTSSKLPLLTWSIQAFDKRFSREKGQLKFAGLLHITKNWKFYCVLYAHSQFLCSFARLDLANRGVRQSVQPHTSYAPLLLFAESLAQGHFCNCKLLNAQPEIFAVMNFCVVGLSVFSSDIPTWRADSWYAVPWHIK